VTLGAEKVDLSRGTGKEAEVEFRRFFEFEAMGGGASVKGVAVASIEGETESASGAGDDGILCSSTFAEVWISLFRAPIMTGLTGCSDILALLPVFLTISASFLSGPKSTS